jgi:hypothetical protein
LADVTLSDKVTTVLEFSESVTMISGVGLTEGDVDGLVQISHPKGSRSVTLRGLGRDGRVLMQVTVAGIVYGIRLGLGSEPDSVVRFAPLSAEGERRLKQKVPLVVQDDRFKEILETVNHSPIKDRSVFEGSQPSSTIGNLEIRLESTFGFASDDIVAIRGQIKNVGSEAVRISDLVPLIRIAGSRNLTPSLFRVSESLAVPGKIVSFTALIAGDGEGHRANFSLKNSFEVIFTAVPPK